MAGACAEKKAGTQKAAAREEGPAEAYAADVVGVRHGDTVFKHPYVAGLLKVAKQRVREALAEQPEDDQWLICVRTYGRAGEHPRLWDLRRFMFRSWQAGNTEAVLDALVQFGIRSFDELALELQTPNTLFKKLKDAGHKVSKTGLGRLGPEVKKKLPPVSDRDFRKRCTPGIQQLTLHALEQALGPDGYKRCLIFVSHEDKDFVSGKYQAALEGTPWASRIVAGVKGAHLQVRFIEAAAPRGAHVVIADDNIREFYVECSDPAEIERQKKAGVQDYMMRPLSFRLSATPLGDASWEFVPEPDIQRFVRGATQRSVKGVCEKVCEGLAATKITEVSELTRMLKVDKYGECDLQECMRSAGTKPLRAAVLNRLREQVKKRLPGRLLFAQRQKPSSGPQKKAKAKAKAKASNKRSSKPELAELIGRAAAEMENHGANIWGVSPSKNHYFLHGAGNQMREKVRRTGIFADYNVKLGLVFGAFFGFRALHDRRRYTRYGQIKDDVERTLRYWHCDGVILRFGRYAAYKNGAQLIGKFHASKGGISAGSSREKHEAESQRALTSMLDEFASRYVRLAKPDEQSSCGLVWSAEGETASAGSGAQKRKTKGGSRETRSSAGGAASCRRQPIASEEEGDAPQQSQKRRRGRLSGRAAAAATAAAAAAAGASSSSGGGGAGASSSSGGGGGGAGGASSSGGPVPPEEEAEGEVWSVEGEPASTCSSAGDAASGRQQPATPEEEDVVPRQPRKRWRAGSLSRAAAPAAAGASSSSGGGAAGASSSSSGGSGGGAGASSSGGPAPPKEESEGEADLGPVEVLYGRVWVQTSDGACEKELKCSRSTNVSTVEVHMAKADCEEERNIKCCGDVSMVEAEAQMEGAGCGEEPETSCNEARSAVESRSDAADRSEEPEASSGGERSASEPRTEGAAAVAEQDSSAGSGAIGEAICNEDLQQLNDA